MSIVKSKGIAVMAEVVAVLARYAWMRVAPVVDREDGVVALKISVEEEGADGLRVLALHDELKFICDMASVRAIASEYQISAEKLEAIIPMMHDDAPPHAVRHLTVAEIEAVVAVLTEETGPSDPPTANDRLLDSALVKLTELARALGGS